MNDSLVVHVGQGIGQTRPQDGGRDSAERAVSKRFRERRTFDELHDQVGLVGLEPGVEESHEARVASRVREPALPVPSDGPAWDHPSGRP